jgi:DNA-binding NarL/FixJ family response regulator
VSWADLSPELRAKAEKALTTKELAVLKRLVAGSSQRRIALDLGISRSAVRSRFEEIRRKLGPIDFNQEDAA